jgi:hypothetical protein
MRLLSTTDLITFNNWIVRSVHHRQGCEQVLRCLYVNTTLFLKWSVLGPSVGWNITAFFTTLYKRQLCKERSLGWVHTHCVTKDHGIPYIYASLLGTTASVLSFIYLLQKFCNTCVRSGKREVLYHLVCFATNAHVRLRRDIVISKPMSRTSNRYNCP